MNPMCSGSCQRPLTVEELCMDVERYMVECFQHQYGYMAWVKENPRHSAYLSEVEGGGWSPYCGSCVI